MGKERLADIRRQDTAIPGAESKPDPRPPPDLDLLSLVASVATARLDEPALELERVGLIRIVIAAGREASRGFDVWLSQTLSEYRGSHSVWDLDATTEHFRHTLAEFDQTLRDNADRLRQLAPDHHRVELVRLA